ncbi:MAG TPA: penicillin-binding protein 2 [Coriobacteriia bacterium]|nr:penicillin-binding protein 2 [Coriobacteriia bacterium]
MPDYRNKLSSRYAIFAGIVFAVLGLLFIKLWTMQVLHGQAYAAQAEENRVREITVPAARGRIFDRNGKALVTNRATLAVAVAPSAAKNQAMIQRLSALLDIPVSEINDKIASTKEAALAPRVVAIDVPLDTVAYLAEHESQFPGVEVRTHAVREYPQGKLAAHVLGYSGEISDTQMADPEFKNYEPTDFVGKAGAEASFESVLQGDRGKRILQVDASGQPRGVIEEVEPVPGRDVKLTIDSRVQKIAERALADAMVDAHNDHFPHAKAGAAVALDVRTGEVLAMASAPTYDPNIFLGGVSEKTWRSLTTTSSEYPLSNRAISGQYPAASTFKAVTGLAGLQYGKTTQWRQYDCEGSWTKMGKQWRKWCWNHAGHGIESFMAGITDSCDVVFYEIGYSFYKDKPKREYIQKMAREFGFGSKLGIDLPGETAGRVPDAKWKRSYNEDYPEYATWLPGDTVNLAIGQGDLLVTPLQLASAYGAIANGGKVVRPHIMKQVLGTDGKPVLTAKPIPAHVPKVSKRNVSIMRSALKTVTTTGTGAGAFRGFEGTVAGKTGTAQVANKDDYAWFVGYVPADNPKYVVAVMVEQGGHGGSVAGPAARQIFDALMGHEVAHVTASDRSR